MCAMRIPAQICEDHFRVVEPQINAEGIHVWPFDPSFPVDVRFMTTGLRQNVRTNRHDYFEVMYLCAGAADLHVQDRLLWSNPLTWQNRHCPLTSLLNQPILSFTSSEVQKEKRRLNRLALQEIPPRDMDWKEISDISYRSKKIMEQWNNGRMED